jgi:hypothetical protein
MNANSVSLDGIKAQGVIRDTDVLSIRTKYNADSHIEQREAEQLIELNRICLRQDATWVDCFVEMLTDYVVNQAIPEGYVTLENAEWLIQQIAPSGQVATKAELELLINVLDKSRWSPQSLVTIALSQVLLAITEGSGPLRDGQPITAGVPQATVLAGAVSDADVEVLRRILYAFGGDGNIAITRTEAECLFAINDATATAENCDSWRDLFVKAVGNCLLAASGYTAPSREQALARERWLERRGDLTLGGMLSAYRAQSREEQAIGRLERQKIEIVTGEEITSDEASWLAGLLGRDSELTPNEIELLKFIKSEKPDVHPDLLPVLDRLPVAA